MKTFKKITSVFLALLLCVGLSGCDTYNNFISAFFETEETPVINFGIFEPLTGANAEGAKEEIAGIELAHELTGYVLGHRIDLIYGDNKSDINMAKTVAQNLVDSNVSVVLGSYMSVLSLAGSDIFKEAKIPSIGITCKNPLVTRTNDYYSRVCYIDAYEGDSMARYVYQTGKSDKVAIFKKQGDDYADNIADSFNSTMDALVGGDAKIQIIEYAPDAESFIPYFMKLAITGCDTIFFPSDVTQAEEIIRLAYENDYKFNWLGTNQWEGIELVNPAYGINTEYYLEGVSYCVDFDIQTIETNTALKLNSVYKNKYGEGANPSEAFALGFDAYMMAVHALEMMGQADDLTNFANTIATTKVFKGATGVITLNDNGDPIKDVNIEQVQGMSVRDIYKVSYQRDEATSLTSLPKDKEIVGVVAN